MLSKRKTSILKALANGSYSSWGWGQIYPYTAYQ